MSGTGALVSATQYSEAGARRLLEATRRWQAASPHAPSAGVAIATLPPMLLLLSPAKSLDYESPLVFERQHAATATLVQTDADA